MRPLDQIMPPVELVLNMEPEELGAKLLFVLRDVAADNSMSMVNRNGFVASLFTPQGGRQSPAFPIKLRESVELAVTEAWVWLEAQGFLIPAPGENGRNGYRVLSRRAAQFEDDTDFTRYSASRYLRKELLHPAIANSVWSAFLRGEYDVAAFQAMKAVEVKVRQAAEYGQAEVGVPLMRKAFDPRIGPLTDKELEGGERQAMSDLFAGAMGSFKNPQSHRNVNLTDPVEAMEVVMLANNLLRIVDRRG
ncbi:TIGR02391 family protein [Nitratireductor luteus]|uniref:TIGR02391 family protein n=1 Tax=Nitratireductor luteus TaxID=2976980 RepID=UPI002240C6BA|nr:TIGR02391 family protein [Nitratireductor luteus]